MNAKLNGWIVYLLLLTAVTASLPSLNAQERSPSPTLTPLYTFLGEADGGAPYAGVTLDPAGNVYGTASAGGSTDDNCGIVGCGVVFKIDTRGHEKLLYTFTGGLDGGVPYAGVYRNSSGLLYGAPYVGGSFGNSDVFKLAPRPNVCASVLCPWNMTILYSLGSMNGDGDVITGNLIQDAAGNTYGMTQYGGRSDLGTVFQVDAHGNETILHTFTGSPDGAYPFLGALILDQAGNLYGTTADGGHSGCFGSGCGIVFKLSPGNGGWTETILYTFTGGADGGNPYAGLLLDPQGNLFGTTFAGGSSNAGTVFELSPAEGGTWTESVPHSFTGTPDGGLPSAPVIRDAQGNLYGTTEAGGQNGWGTIFEMTPNGSSWTETPIWNFTGMSDGAVPFGGLAMDAQGNLYGTTPYGGSVNNQTCGGGCGVVFKLSQ